MLAKFKIVTFMNLTHPIQQENSGTLDESFPKVSIIWLNYNSSPFINIVKESIDAILSLDYPCFELIIVDNGSNDDSYASIKHTVQNKFPSSNVKFLGLSKNLGFTGGNNAGYSVADQTSEYVALINNDAIPTKDSLRSFVSLMERDPSIGAAQGLVVYYKSDIIDNAGWFLDEFLFPHAYQNLCSKNMPLNKTKISYAGGIYVVYRLNALRNAVGGAKIFQDILFAHFEDAMLGLQLWDHGFNVVSFPFLSAFHKGSASFKKVKLFAFFLTIRNRMILNEISNSRYRRFLKIATFSSAVTSCYINILRHDNSRLPAIVIFKHALKGIVEGSMQGRRLLKQGVFFDLYRSPLLSVSLPQFFFSVMKNQHNAPLYGVSKIVPPPPSKGSHH